MSQIRSLAVRDGNEVYDAYLSSLMKLRWSEKQIMRLLGNLGELWCAFFVYGIGELASVRCSSQALFSDHEWTVLY